jgi:mono/diheme cytochrome c family protein
MRNNLSVQYLAKYILYSTILLAGLISCRHEPLTINGENPIVPSTNDTTSSLDGVWLYNSKCVNCHDPISTSSKLGVTANEIQYGINNISDMHFLSVLTSGQIIAIANALKTDTTIIILDGTALYINKCAGCHGPLESSSKLGASVADIQNGISSVNDMKYLTSLTSKQIQSISTVLQTTTPVPLTDGTVLYNNNCANCHGPLVTSSKLGATVSRIQNAITSVSEMKTITNLTSTQIQNISEVLSATPMPTDGESLYAINCARCHNNLSNSEVGGSSVSKIQEAIREKRQMNYLSFLTATQLQAISGVLANIKGEDD